MDTIENFKEWLFYKFKINNLTRKHIIKQGEVYWCSLGVNVGDEQNGKGLHFRRPVLVFKKFNNNIFLGIPLSTKSKDNKYYITITIKDIVQSAIISQIRIIDTKRLDEKIGYISKKDFEKVQSEFISMISQ